MSDQDNMIDWYIATCERCDEKVAEGENHPEIVVRAAEHCRLIHGEPKDTIDQFHFQRTVIEASDPARMDWLIPLLTFVVGLAVGWLSHGL